VSSIHSLAELTARVDRLAERSAPDRAVLGITGPPGAGKTTLADALVQRLNVGPTGKPCSSAAHVPMDGFHLADIELDRLGRRARKGAPDTFDPGGYFALLGRLRTTRDTVWAPAFDRHVEQPIAGSIAVGPDVRIIISEGNYLLSDEPGWRGGQGVFDEIWYCGGDTALRVQRLVERHQQFGKSLEEATRWIQQVDDVNAAMIERTRDHADVVITGDVVIGVPAVGAGC